MDSFRSSSGGPRSARFPAAGFGRGAEEGMDGFAGEVFSVLRRHISEPNARAVISTCRARVEASGERFGPETLGAVVEHVEGALKVFDVPTTRRDLALNELRALARGGGAPQSGPQSSPQSFRDVSIALARDDDDPPPPPSRRDPPFSARGGDGPFSARGGAGPLSIRPEATINIARDEDVISARDAGRTLCRTLGFSETDQTKVATAISELARNILHYAIRGTITVSRIAGATPGVEVVAADDGPGISDVDSILAPGYRSPRGTGFGLRGTRRLVDYFDIVTHPGRGTRVTVRKHRA
ncbi:anti-sigma regulatory factor [Polyangium aurulentum]|uniref:anti-sigma regulatory factor n=1 Tax=Polyangium aurulentum TaxID=2567896 RepID=UPI00200DFD14|nr:anti-sigma regulatory factor [Polyangium aurulentum]UQA58502.1 anti-sigma regulatory factor [Polyangium aurulentum]